MKPHFVCIGGCGKMSETQTKCNSIGCWRARNPLGECFCTDNKHTDFYTQYNLDIEKVEKLNISNSD